jgi:iron-sulfur cluster repair protein YtfE (RIC family)
VPHYAGSADPRVEEAIGVIETLTAALEREHHEIDAGIASFLEGLARGEARTEALEAAVAALRRHIFLEEEFLFPPLREAGLLPPVLVMLREHGAIWRALDSLDAVSAPGEGRELCEELLALLAAHNAKEEPIIYPQGDLVLADEARRELHSFIDSGQMPHGWACAQAKA